jgi:hypothetical protein
VVAVVVAVIRSTPQVLSSRAVRVAAYACNVATLTQRQGLS